MAAKSRWYGEEPGRAVAVSPERWSFFGSRPERAILKNIDVDSADDETSLPSALEFFINPDQLEYATRAEWARITVPGLSHEVLQYSHSASDEISFDLEWSAHEAQRRVIGLPNIPGYQKSVQDRLFLYHEFLRALTVPLERGKAPSRVALIWPGFLHVIGVITSVNFSFTRFSRRGPIAGFTAGVEMVELRTVFRKRRGTKTFFNAGDEANPPVLTITPVQEP